MSIVTKTKSLLVIMGPTSSGKSSLAIEIAKRWNGEIISADSRQVYRGMDIGTGKVTEEEQEEAHHHLLDVADPNDDYNVSHFVHDAHMALEDISSRKKLPIICGGTGFWIQALVENQELPSVPPDPALRKALSKKTIEELLEILIKLDPECTEKIDKKNPRRLIRAIEIAQDPNYKLQVINYKKTKQRNNQLLLALCPQKDILDARIRARLETRFNQGMIEEVARLQSEGVSWERLDAFGLEYRWISRYLRKALSLEEMKEKLYFDSIHYGKRQMTWIRRWQRLGAPIHIIETPEEAMKIAEEFLKKEDCPKTLSGS